MSFRPFLVLLVFMLAACTPAIDLRPTATINRPTGVAAPTSAAAPTRIPTAPQPTAVPFQSTAVPQQAGAQFDELSRIAGAQPERRDQFALARMFKAIGTISPVARTEPLNVRVGEIETFWVSDPISQNNYSINAELRYVGPVALLYVDTTLNVPQEAIERSAREFETRIYPRNRALFGPETAPGIDGDPRLTILNTRLRGVGGYFSTVDTMVKAVNRFSNERDMFVIGYDSFQIGTESYESTLAHEFQHMIEWSRQAHNPSWFDEGMATLAEDLNGYTNQTSASRYLAAPDLQLTTWESISAHYGCSVLFMRYFYEHYAGDSGLTELIEGNAGSNPEVFARIAARKRPDIKTFADLYGDWAVANLVNNPSISDGRYAYTLLPNTVKPVPAEQSGSATVNQFGADYLGEIKGPATIQFTGSPTITLTGVSPTSGRYAWWSNRGDEIVSTLIRPIDLQKVQKATLQFSTWYETERNYDYAFIGISTDNGATWQTLPGRATTPEDPQGHNYGNGWTGVSGAPEADQGKGTRGIWVDEQIDLSAYAGRQALLGFWLSNDAAINGPGMLIDTIRIPEIGFNDDAENGENGWQARGFARVTGMLDQHWILRLVRTNAQGTTVESVPLDSNQQATITLAEGERATLVIAGATPFTTEPAIYSYQVATP